MKILWERSLVPLSREILVEYTGLSERKLDKYLTRLVDQGVLGVDADEGEMLWEVRGALRDPTGPETLERFERIQQLRAEARARVRGERLAPKPEREQKPDRAQEDGDDGEVDRENRSLIRAGAGLTKGALGLVAKAAAPLDSRKAKKPKSLALSAGLSLLGPLGWLYAGSFREAIPASLIYLGLAAIIPNALLWPILWFALPISALAGLVYGWQYNRKGQRTPIFIGSGKKTEDDEDD